MTVNLNGIKFETDILGGHKTGMYLDQQSSYEAVAQFAKGANVLDCFSFLGGFGLHAARAGAKQVLMLDQSADAVAASPAQCGGERAQEERGGGGDQCLRLAQGEHGGEVRMNA